MRTSTLGLFTLLSLSFIACGDKDTDDTGASGEEGTTDDTGSDDGGDDGGDEDGGADDGGGDGDTIDLDGDGDPAIADGGTDCDDDDPDIHPGAPESCDDVDSDCDGDLVDDFENLDGDDLPDCADDDACVAAPDSLLVWLQGDDHTDAMGTTTTMDGSDTIAYEAGIVGNAVRFDGDSGAWDFNPDPWLVSPLSVEVWLKPSPTGTTQVVLSHYECGMSCSSGGYTSPSAYILSLDEGGRARFVVRDADAPNGTSADVVEGATNLTDGDWHHLVAVMDTSAQTLDLYVDGELESSADMEGNDGSGFAQDGDSETDPITIGFQLISNSTDARNIYTGLMDELSVYEGALSASEVTALHGAGIAGKCE